jgi:translocation and assembly module TamA
MPKVLGAKAPGGLPALKRPCRIALMVLIFLGSWIGRSLCAESPLSYEVRIQGVTEPSLRQLLEDVSDTVKLRGHPPISIGLLRRRVREDVPKFLQALRSRGYYAAKVDTDLDAAAAPIQITFHVETGPQYLLEDVDISISAGQSIWKLSLPKPADIGLKTGEPTTNQKILQAGAELVDFFKDNGYPFAEMAEQKVIVYHAKHSITPVFKVTPGPEARFGVTEITGLQTVDEQYVRNKIPWKAGERFNAALLKNVRKKLIDTGLFGIINVKPADKLTADGRLPVTIEVKERKHRTIRAGVNYQTDKGPGTQMSWEHRNVFGSAERLFFEAVISEIAFAGEGYLRLPEFMRPDQTLQFNLRAAEDRPDAYTSRNITGTAGLERALSNKMNVAAGVGFRLSETDQLGKEGSFRLLFLPMEYDWDTSDSLLDPSRGGRLDVEMAPYQDVLDTDLRFFKFYTSYSRYLEIVHRPLIILAGRSAFGSITGQNRNAVPADLRFYAGGGGSVRGFAFQSAGPLEDDEPVGGNSLFEFSAEARVKVTKRLGFVTFLDGGSAFSSEFPDFDEGLFWGAGVGLRYYTPIGPVRADIGFPLNPRDGVDDPFQIYLSLGQAF